MNFKKYLALGTALTLTLLAGCGSSGSGDDQIVIYSNADEEAITAMENALDAGGYEGKYIVQTYGTSELGGKLLAEGTNLEADLVTMSTFYLQSAQEQNNMFLPLDFEVNTLEEVPDYTAPITSQEGAIILNTELMASENLPTPTCLKDLADPVYAGQVAVTDIQSSSTAWLLIQALVDAYGEDGAEETLAAIYDNFESTVIVLFTDLETPMIPVIFPNDKPEDNGSVGIPLSKTDIEKEEIIKNLVTVKSRQNFGFIGYKDGENKFTYPRFGRAKAEELLARLSELADYVIVDCVSSLESNPLASTAVELADQIIRLASPDLRSISYYLSQLPLYVDSKYQSEKQIQGLNTPNADVFMPIEEAKSHLKDLAFTLPYSRQVKEQAQKGTLYEKTTDKKFQSRITEIARKVVEYDAD